MTTLRSTPAGRGGLDFGSSPLATRSVQSPKYLNGTPPSWPARRLIIHSPVWPEETRRIQASSPDLNSPKAPGIVRVEFLAKLMAADAVDIVHPLAPDVLRDLLRNLGAAAKILCRRNLHQGVPVDRRIIMRRCGLVRRRNSREIDLLAGLGAQLGRIHQPVAAHPDGVVHVRRQVRDHIAALVVGDDDLGEFRRQLRRLRDHPDAGLRAVGPEHHAADVVIVDGDRRRLLRMQRSRRHAECARRQPR